MGDVNLTCLDLETRPIGPRPEEYPPRPVGLAIRWPGGQTEYLAWGHPDGNNCSEEEAKRAWVKACQGPVYLTFDCDGLDASLVPALGTPEPGGLGWYDTLNLITALANGPGILGMDISEIAPIEGFVAPQFCVARLIYRILGRIKAGRRVH